MNKFLLIALICLALTFLFDYICWKIEQEIELEAQWKAVNNKREREGKKRWDE
jgi:hypothetical protein